MTADWPAGTIYEAISRLPWVEALAAWEEGTTYTRGIHFDDKPGACDLDEPDVGDAGPCVARYGIRLTRAVQFAVERRHGWVETEDTPPRNVKDTWDERRRVRMMKPQPNGAATLQVEGSYAGFRTSPDLYEPACYSLTRKNDVDLLEDVQWADWDASGRMLIATVDGRLQAREYQEREHEVVFEHDLSGLTPEPVAAPAWAGEW
mgnify:CR=1 FL=1